MMMKHNIRVSPSCTVTDNDTTVTTETERRALYQTQSVLFSLILHCCKSAAHCMCYGKCGTVPLCYRVRLGNGRACNGRKRELTNTAIFDSSWSLLGRRESIETHTTTRIIRTATIITCFELSYIAWALDRPIKQSMSTQSHLS